MKNEKFKVLYNSDGTYSIIETHMNKSYEFTYKHRNLSYEEVTKCIKALKEGYIPPEKEEKNPLKRMQAKQEKNNSSPALKEHS